MAKLTIKKIIYTLIHGLLVLLVIGSLLACAFDIFSAMLWLADCFGPVCKKTQIWFPTFAAFFILIYLIVVIAVLYKYAVYMIRHKSPRGGYILLIPFLFVLLYVGVIFYITDASDKEALNSEIGFYTPQPQDYVCTPNRFIHYVQTFKDSSGYYRDYEDRIHHKMGEGVNTGINYNYEKLTNVLKKDGIDINQCKNKFGDSPSSSEPLPEDYVCSSTIFVIYQDSEEDTIYDLRQRNPLKNNLASKQVYTSYAALQTALQQKSIDIKQCKNKTGDLLPSQPSGIPFFSPDSSDFICNPDRYFIFQQRTSPSGEDNYIEYIHGQQNIPNARNYYQSYEQIKKSLQKNAIDISKCKNQAGEDILMYQAKNPPVWETP